MKILFLKTSSNNKLIRFFNFRIKIYIDYFWKPLSNCNCKKKESKEM